MKSDEAIAAEQALEEKLAAAGAGDVRRHTFSDEPAAPEQGTPAQPTEPATETAAAQEPPAPAAEDTTPAAETAPVEGDAAAAAVLAKYGNDPAKLAQAHAALQRKLGEQGTELGQTRAQAEEAAQLRAELETIKSRLDERPPAQVDQATVDWFDEQVLTNPAQAIEWARENRNDLLFTRGIQVWKDTDPFAASQYVTDLKIENERQQFAKQLKAQPRGNGVNDALSNVLARRPEFAQYADDLSTVLARNTFAGAAYTDAVASGDQQRIEGAIETLFALAEGDTLRTIALSGVTPTDSRSAAAVAATTTSQDRPEEAGTKEPTGQERFRDEFREEAERQRGGVFAAS